MFLKSRYKIAAFTLLELSIVVVILALLAAASLRHVATTSDANNTLATNQNMDVVETALMNYQLAYNRLPCPALSNGQEGTTTFGVEVGTVGDGYCGTTGGQGGTAPSFKNSTADPDNSDANYDSNTLSQVVAGAVPTRALNLDDKYAYDVWGRKLLYVVDKRITAFNAFTTYPVYSSGPTTGPIQSSYFGTIGAIVIKNLMTAGDKCSAGTTTQAYQSCLQDALTTKAIYALISFGKNGHGGYVRNSAIAATIFKGSSTNADELNNCHCNTAGNTTNFNRIFVQKPVTPSATPGASFDDIVRFKNRSQMVPTSSLQ